MAQPVTASAIDEPRAVSGDMAPPTLGCVLSWASSDAPGGSICSLRLSFRTFQPKRQDQYALIIPPVTLRYHYDLNFLTVHGKSRFPGLFVWRRDGRRVPVRVPEGCLLVQAGKQLEILTGGEVMAGMHEVSSRRCQGSSSKGWSCVRRLMPFDCLLIKHRPASMDCGWHTACSRQADAVDRNATDSIVA